VLYTVTCGGEGVDSTSGKCSFSTPLLPGVVADTAAAAGVSPHALQHVWRSAVNVSAKSSDYWRKLKLKAILVTSFS